MFVADGPFFSGCLTLGALFVFGFYLIMFMCGNWLADTLHISYAFGWLIVFCGLWWYIRHRRRKKTEDRIEVYYSHSN